MPMTRVVIAGTPRSGKSTLAGNLAEGGIPVLHTDDLIGSSEWSEQSRLVADEWFSKNGPWIVEGMTAVRALRKWLETHPEGRPCDVVYWGEQAKTYTTPDQKAMGLGHSRIWQQVRVELVRRGCELIHF